MFEYSAIEFLTSEQRWAVNQLKKEVSYFTFDHILLLLNTYRKSSLEKAKAAGCQNNADLRFTVPDECLSREEAIERTAAYFAEMLYYQNRASALKALMR